MRIIELDFECRSLINLKKAGAEKYARDPSTEILCLLWLNNGLWHTWHPAMVDDGVLSSHRFLVTAAKNEDYIFTAHNAGFEEAIWRNIMVPLYGFPELPIERWDCTMAACAVKGWPLKLGDAGHWAGNQWKDMPSSKFTIDLSKVEGRDIRGRLHKARWDERHKYPTVTDWRLPDVFEADLTGIVIPYCKQDVVVEKSILNRVGILRGHSKERTVWLDDQRMNHRGVALDVPFILAASTVVRRAAGPLLQKFQTITGLQKLGSPRLKDWCMSNGVAIENLQKTTIDKLIRSHDEDENDDYGIEEDSLAGNDVGGTDFDWVGLPDQVREALQIKALLGGAAVKKLPSMLACVCNDGRAYGVTQFYAAHTGRWGGRLFQPQNFPRQSAGADPELVVAAIMSGDPAVVESELGMPALVAVARALRHAIIAPPGKQLVVGDYKSIEAVIVLALAGRLDLAQQLAGGLPVYMEMAEQIYNQPRGTWAVADKELYKRYKELEHVQEYTIGKNTILGCGFQMGPEKFRARYCPEQPVEFAEHVVDTYRKQFAPEVRDMWYDLERVSLAAVKGKPGATESGIYYELNDDWLVGNLPNGWQKIWYPKPRLGVGKFDNECWAYQRSSHGQGVVQMYGGLETENYVQALARGILCGALHRLDQAGWNPILTCHDEITCEVDEDMVDLKVFDELMTRPDRSSAGIPIAVESWYGKRYKK